VNRTHRGEAQRAIARARTEPVRARNVGEAKRTRRTSSGAVRTRRWSKTKLSERVKSFCRPQPNPC